MRTRVENWFGAAYRLTVFDAGDRIIMEGERDVDGHQVVGRWQWRTLAAGARLVVRGMCASCRCYELRGLGWMAPECLPGQYHRWAAPEFTP